MNAISTKICVIVFLMTGWFMVINSSSSLNSNQIKQKLELLMQSPDKSKAYITANLLPDFLENDENLMWLITECPEGISLKFFDTHVRKKCNDQINGGYNTFLHKICDLDAIYEGKNLTAKSISNSLIIFLTEASQLINTPNENNDYPIHILASVRRPDLQEYAAEIVATFYDKGSLTCILNFQGKTPMQLAEEANNQPVIKALIAIEEQYQSSFQARKNTFTLEIKQNDYKNNIFNHISKVTKEDNCSIEIPCLPEKNDLSHNKQTRSPNHIRKTTTPS